MNVTTSPGPQNYSGFWIDHADHRTWLARQADQQLAFFAHSLQADAGFATLDHSGIPLANKTQELHTTTRLVHSYALAKIWGHPDADKVIEQGMSYLSDHHHDSFFGGYIWALNDGEMVDDRKLAYGHMFVLLAAASAKQSGHPTADAMLKNTSKVLDQHFWEEDTGLFCDELNRDWTPFSTYRGMNANMHASEALLTAYEATGDEIYLDRAGRILDFFINKIAPQNDWRLPEHYTENWDIDHDYAGDPMFRPAGTTPGHSFELGRLLLQHWDLKGRPPCDAPLKARHLIERALHDASLPDGGLAYTLKFGGDVDVSARFWWPVTEAIGAIAALIKLERREADEIWYRKLWTFANANFIDHTHGGWFPEIDNAGNATSTIFAGKPDIYHALQACLFPLTPGLSRHSDDLKHMR
ncbi:AGE family epimerase/isomerase [Pacificibacter marinus]|uniref:Putative sugar isomerase YihS n=1 Tax=Pacificibacter marinus TaxID=658057 RepID=A0A1Y5RV35_9RHOB|nr:AGE family epimerase/isomerase [Pacificibacter marinus]SEK43944.1 Mannose or cellobiose epimerase, N-acyl-D-glucosamine 2-epimerase family [Pacificibacter marinus]SLN23418.1 putative sugar isomerase YihS [Pacificibacter marinus]